MRRRKTTTDPPFNDFGAHDTLLRVQVGRRLVNQVDVSWLAEAEGHGGSLQFSSGKVLHLLVHDVVDAERLHDVRHKLGVDVGVADLVVKQLADRPFGLGRYLLRLVADVQLGHFG